MVNNMRRGFAFLPLLVIVFFIVIGGLFYFTRQQWVIGENKKLVQKSNTIGEETTLWVDQTVCEQLFKEEKWSEINYDNHLSAYAPNYITLHTTLGIFFKFNLPQFSETSFWLNTIGFIIEDSTKPATTFQIKEDELVSLGFFTSDSTKKYYFYDNENGYTILREGDSILKAKENSIASWSFEVASEPKVEDHTIQDFMATDEFKCFVDSVRLY